LSLDCNFFASYHDMLTYHTQDTDNDIGRTGKRYRGNGRGLFVAYADIMLDIVRSLRYISYRFKLRYGRWSDV